MTKPRSKIDSKRKISFYQLLLSIVFIKRNVALRSETPNVTPVNEVLYSSTQLTIPNSF